MRTPDFFENTPATINFAKSLHKERRVLNPNETPIQFLANKMISFSSADFKEINKILS